MLERIAKFSFAGAAIVGALAYLHVWGEAHQFAASGQQPVNDPRLVTLSITVLGVVVGAVLGALVGVVVSVIKRR